MAKTGRPSKFDQAVVDAILERVSDGVPLRKALRDLVIEVGQDKIPEVTTFYDWVNASESLSQRFARARLEGFDAIAEETLEIADDSSRDYVEVDGRRALDAENIQRAKLRVETRHKLLAKWDPKRYGERTALDHGNQDGKPFMIIASSKDESL